MTPEQLVNDAAEAVAALSGKVRESVTMGKPGEAVDYAMALSSATSAYRDLVAAVNGE